MGEIYWNHLKIEKWIICLPTGRLVGLPHDPGKAEIFEKPELDF